MQDELLELQASMHKTIVFITHDLDEALKIGDRIAIMKDGAVVQIGTPEEILTEPADDYVRAFVQNVDKSKVITAGAVMRTPRTITLPKDGPHVAVRSMEKAGTSTIYAVNANRQLQGIVRIEDMVALEKKGEKTIPDDNIITDLFISRPDTPVGDLLGKAMEARYPISICDDEGRLRGILDRATVLSEVVEEEQDAATLSLQEMKAETGDLTKVLAEEN
jgi:glycine betaine/proline transport system ATP-binding protein